eukprot:1159202-Pelagomonas_calceolata.AAC.14
MEQCNTYEKALPGMQRKAHCVLYMIVTLFPTLLSSRPCELNTTPQTRRFYMSVSARPMVERPSGSTCLPKCCHQGSNQGLQGSSVIHEGGPGPSFATNVTLTERDATEGQCGHLGARRPASSKTHEPSSQFGSISTMRRHPSMLALCSDAAKRHMRLAVDRASKGTDHRRKNGLKDKSL